MLETLRQRTSLKGFSRYGRGGQIATLLILMMVVSLILIFATVNIGEVSLLSTRISNAADSSALLLGSLLATRSGQMFDAFGHTYITCQRSGWLPTLTAIIGAIVALVVISIVAPGASIVAPAIIGGAIGGAVGGEIKDPRGNGMLTGMLNGAAIGAGLATGNPSLRVLGTGGALYNSYISEQVDSDTLRAMAKAASPQRVFEGVRESVIFNALIETVDDVRKVRDDQALDIVVNPNGFEETITVGPDIDGDGKLDEQVPYFSYWWEARQKAMWQRPRQEQGIIQAFLDEMQPFENRAEHFFSWLARKEVECDCSSPLAEGKAIELWRAIEENHTPVSGISPSANGWDVSFWMGQPDYAALEYWMNPPGCVGTACGAPLALPLGWDRVDRTNLDLHKFKNLWDSLNAQTIEQLTQNYAWVTALYDEEAAGGSTNKGWFNVLRNLSGELDLWMAETRRLRDGLPGCQMDYLGNGSPINVPVIERLQYENNCPRTSSTSAEWCGPCWWQKYYVGVSYTYLPNSLCKLYTSDQSKLATEIGNVESFMSNIIGHIKSDHKPPSSEYCNSNCDYFAGWIGNPDVTSVKLEGNMHGPGSRQDLDITETATLTYSYDYQYRCGWTVYHHQHCKCCHYTSGCSDGCDGCRPHRHRGRDSSCGDCSYYTYPTADCSGSDTQTEYIYAGDLNIPDPLSLSAFNAAVAKFRSDLNVVPDDFATINGWLGDRTFSRVLKEMQEFKNDIDGFYPKIEDFYINMRPYLYNTTEGNVTYSWTDSRGPHAVTVEVGPAKLAWVEETETSIVGGGAVDETCYVMKDYAGSERVNITRKDPAGKNLGILGKWNPFDPDRDGMSTIKKSAKVKWKVGNVSLEY